MAEMLATQIVTILCRLPIPGSTIAQDSADARDAASDPSKTQLDCPWNHHGDSRYFRARRVAWRLAFRAYRERSEITFITTIEREAA
jgi:hypothetical protein